MFLGISLAAVSADLASKHAVFTSMLHDADLAARAGPVTGLDRTARAARIELGLFQRQVAPGVRFTLSTNPGAVFGLRMPRWLMGGATIATVAIVFYFFAVSVAGAWTIHVALAMILGGALGNLYDRMFSRVVVPGFEAIRYQVRDFIDCSQIGYKWVFNVADAWLVIGVALLAVHWIAESVARNRAEARPSADRSGA
jgi:lipoprotein signal peptidase